MIECIDDIRTRIETVKNKTDSSIIYDTEIDKYLDAILALKKFVDDITGDINSLVDDLHCFISKSTSYDGLEIESLIGAIENLYCAASKFYIQAKESKFYPGLKTSVNECHSSLAGLKELIHDLDLFLVKLPNDEEYITLSHKINEIFA